MGIISRIKGELVGHERRGAVAIETPSGVTYAVIVSDRDRTVIWQRGIGGQVELLTRHVIREDDELLFGFLAVDEAREQWKANGGMTTAELARDVFDAITEIKGCGGAVAMKLLSHVTPQDADGFLRGEGDSTKLAKLVGKLTALKVFGVRRPK